MTPLPAQPPDATLHSSDALSPDQRWQEERIFFHDILNTASGLRGLTEMLGRAPSPSAEQLLPAVQALASQLVEEIQLRRDLLHAEHGSLILDEIEIPGQHLLESCLSAHRVKASAQQVTLDITPGPDVVLRSDPERIQRVLGILLRNAIDASSAGDIITVRSIVSDSNWEITIHNAAVIPAELRQTVCERGVSSQGAGRGLGLYIARLLLEVYLQGTLTWSSAEAKGTTFCVRLPLSESKPSPPTPAPIPHATGGQASSLVLLVDDNAVNRKVSSTMLTRLAVPHDVAENGQEAVVAVQQGRYGLILMDCMMPIMDGLEATRQIRCAEQATNQHIPIIAMTAHSATEDIHACQEAGMDDFIAKPMSLNSLQAILAKWMPDLPSQSHD